VFFHWIYFSFGCFLDSGLNGIDIKKRGALSMAIGAFGCFNVCGNRLCGRGWVCITSSISLGIPLRIPRRTDPHILGQILLPLSVINSISCLFEFLANPSSRYAGWVDSVDGSASALIKCPAACHRERNRNQQDYNKTT
jgi:hypothetical protein